MDDDDDDDDIVVLVTTTTRTFGSMFNAKTCIRGRRIKRWLFSPMIMTTRIMTRSIVT
jgi:hypothetical protein